MNTEPKIVVTKDMEVLMTHLVRNGQMRMAGHVMISFLVRSFRLDNQEAKHYMVQWIYARFPTELRAYYKYRYKLQ